MYLFRLKDSNPTSQKFNEHTLVLVALVFGCFAISPMAQAVSPPPDGGYPNNNTAEGTAALLSLTTGADNTAVGLAALALNSDGSDNTAVGTAALLNNTASNNTAIGSVALFHNTTGLRNTATGFGALFSNTTIGGAEGNDNTAVGAIALASNTTGANNTALGSQALQSNNDTSFATAIGTRALLSASIGNSNVAVGFEALANKTAGANNTALGTQAGNNLITGGGNIYIGNPGVDNDNGTIRIGNLHSATFIAGIFGQTSTNGIAVSINSDGKLGTATSSKRFKEEIKPMDKASEVLLALKPVSFRYKKEIDPVGTSQFGLVAEDVEKVNPDLVVRDKEGRPYTVRYDAVNAMLLNEFLKEHRKNQEQEATIAQLKKQVEALTRGLQRVSAQVELKQPAPQMIVENQ